MLGVFLNNAKDAGWRFAPCLTTGNSARMIQPSASYTVIRWLRRETIAMIGSPAVRVAIDSIDRAFRLLPASAKLPVAANRARTAMGAS
jgi:hypothetical protein